MTDIAFNISPEAELDRRLEELIGKIVASQATPEERSEYRTLAAIRTRLLRPTRPQRRSLGRLSRMRAATG